MTSQGMPKDERLISNIKTMFTNLSKNDYMSDMYLVCRIWRNGSLILESSDKQKNKQQNQDTIFKRPFGCAVLALTPDVISQHLMNATEYNPGTIPIYVTPQESNFHSIHECM